MPHVRIVRPAVLGCLLVMGLVAAEAMAQSRAAFDAARNKMVDDEIVAAGVKNPRVVQAMRDTPRHEFVSLNQRKNAYFDMALPIGEGQTISPPFVVAYMTETLDPQPGDNVLEIGTGSGYQAAVLAKLVRDVYTIEIVEKLGHKAEKTLERLHYDNVHVKVGDGYQGWPEHAPFDKIIVTCSPEKVPPALVEQLREGGRMVIPVGERYQQTLCLMKKRDGKMVSEKLQPTLFVPMTGEAESQRKVLPDPAHPAIENGGFELVTSGDPPVPTGWHYQRQLELVVGKDAPEGKNYITFSNVTPGRSSQARQGFAVERAESHPLADLRAGPRQGHSSGSERAAVAPHRRDLLRREPGHGGRGRLGSVARHVRLAGRDQAGQRAPEGPRGRHVHRSARRRRRTLGQRRRGQGGKKVVVSG